MRGIILAGGAGTRLAPLTRVTSKQLLPVYNKPMIYFPLETLLKAGIKEILIIVAPDHAGDFVKLLGSGQEFGCKISYEVQEKPAGLAQAFIIGENFIDKENVTLILGDNLFEEDFIDPVKNFKDGALVFATKVPDPQRFGVVEFDENKKVLSIVEKPKEPKSDYAVTGLYVYDNTVVEKAKSLQPSARGEIEITDLNNLYLKDGKLEVAFVQGKWLDTGTFEALYQATEFVREKEMKQGSATPTVTPTPAAPIPTTPVVPVVSTESKPATQIPNIETPVASAPVSTSAATPSAPAAQPASSTPDLEIPPEIASMLSATPGAQ
jgi:glucose-1-phosphate thymidylyltransferase